MGLLGRPDFRALWVGAGLSEIASRMTAFVLPLLAVTELRAAAWQVGLVGALGTAAFLLVGLPAGAVVDRVRQRRLLLRADLARAVLLAALGLAAALGGLGLVQLCVTAFAVGVLTVFFDVAHQSYLPRLVGRDDLVEGNARLATVAALAQVTGPAAAGGVAVLTDLRGTTAVVTACFAGSALCLTRIGAPDPRPAAGPPTGRRRLAGEVLAGLRYVFGDPVLRTLAISGGLYNLAALALLSMAPVRFVADLRASPAAMSLFLSAGGAGGVAGALLARRVAARVGRYRMARLALLTTTPFGFLVPLAGSAGTLWLAAAGWAVVWVGASLYNVAQVSVRQERCPTGMLGRMNATLRFVVWGAMPLGSLAGGLLGSAFGARTALVAGAAGLVLACVPLCTTSSDRVGRTAWKERSGTR